MADATQTMRFRFWLWLIRFVGLIVPRRLRTDWRQEWEAELRYREALLAEWAQLNWRTKLDLFWHSAGALMEALWLQPQKWEDEMSFRQSGLNSKLIVPPPSQFAERTQINLV